MSDYSNIQNNNLFWNIQDRRKQTLPNFESDYNSFHNQQLDFQSFSQNESDFPQFINNTVVTSILEPEQDLPHIEATDYDEPPLLEELEIYPERIIEKMIAVLNPFRGHSLADDSDFLTQGTDLAGPLSFCILLALSLFISGRKIYFGYIYGLSAMSCVMMYWLLSLLTETNMFTLTCVSSILGYSLLPIVTLSVLGIFISLNGTLGIIITIIAILWSSLSSSRLFVAISGDKEQRPLIAYPNAIIYGVFALLVIF